MSNFTPKNGNTATIDLAAYEVRCTATDTVDFRDVPVEITNLQTLTNQSILFEPEGALIRNIVDEALRGEIQFEFLEPVSICFLDMDGRSQCSAMRMKMEFLLEELGIDIGCDASRLLHDESGRFVKPLAGNLTLGVHGSVVIQDDDELSVRHLTDSEVQKRLSFLVLPEEPRQTYDYAVVYPTSEEARIFDSSWQEERRSQEGANIARIEAAAQAGGLHTRVINLKAAYTPSSEGDRVFGPLFRIVLADQMFRGNVRIHQGNAQAK
jgi:hypothetical protein